MNDPELLKEYEKEQTEEIKKVFEAYGAIGSVFVTIDKVKKTPYAFVSFVDHESGKKVVEKFSQRKYHITYMPIVLKKIETYLTTDLRYT